MAKIQINDEVRDMTAEEEAQRQADLDARSIQETNMKTYEDLKASAKAKLISGDPLTAEEADTIVL